MPSSQSYLDFIMDQLSSLDGVCYRAMMGEYILYYKDRVIGGIYDDRLLVKPTKTAGSMMPDASIERPYPGGREMIMVDNVDDSEFLCRLVEAVADELPLPRKYC